MIFKTKHHWSGVIDFLVSNLITVLALAYSDSVLGLLSTPYLPDFIDTPEPYTGFIEGLMAGALMGVYIVFRKKINILSMMFGMWLYPLSKYMLHRPVNDVESWLNYLSELSVFVGIFCMLFHLAHALIAKAR